MSGALLLPLLFALTWAMLWLSLLPMATLFTVLKGMVRRHAPRLLTRPTVIRALERHPVRASLLRAYAPALGILLIGVAATLFIGEDFVELGVKMHEGNPTVLDLDRRALSWASGVRSTSATVFFTAFTRLGTPIGLAVVTMVGVLAIFRGHRDQAMYLVTTAILGGALNVLLKGMFARARPDLAAALSNAQGYSFPSGHAMGSTVVLGAISYVVMRAHFSWRVRSSIIALLAAVTLTIGISRVYLGVHWLSDIAAGFAAGLVWLITATVAFELYDRIHHIRHSLPPER